LTTGNKLLTTDSLPNERTAEAFEMYHLSTIRGDKVIISTTLNLWQ